MHGDLLVLLAAAWLGLVLRDVRAPIAALVRTWPAAVAIAVAVVVQLAPVVPAPIDFLVALAYASVLLSLGEVLLQDGRRHGALHAVAVIAGGLLAVALRAAFTGQPVLAPAAAMLVPAGLQVLLAPAAAAMHLRLRETDAPAALRGPAVHAVAAASLACGLVAVLPP